MSPRKSWTLLLVSCATLCLGNGCPPNQLPVAHDQNVAVVFETATDITLTASDPDNGPNLLTYSIVSSPSHGSLSAITGNQVTYTPDTDYSGPESFTFKANDDVAVIAEYANCSPPRGHATLAELVFISAL